MYTIVGKENLEAVNLIADRAMRVLKDISDREESGSATEVVSVSTDYLASLASGYLFLYSAVLDHGILPSQKAAKHRTVKIH
jgi:hypothetical protein